MGRRDSQNRRLGEAELRACASQDVTEGAFEAPGSARPPRGLLPRTPRRAYDPRMQPERLSRETVYRSPWVNLHADRIRLASGRVIERMHVVDVEDDGVAAVVEDADGRVLMVRVPRYATGTCEWEVPEGRAAPGETPEDAARREVLEETGWTASIAERLHTFHPVPGLSNHVLHVVRGRAVALTGGFDRDEIAEVRWFGPDEVRSMLRERRVKDGFTMIALYLHLEDRPA